MRRRYWRILPSSPCLTGGMSSGTGGYCHTRGRAFNGRLVSGMCTFLCVHSWRGHQWSVVYLILFHERRWSCWNVVVLPTHVSFRSLLLRYFPNLVIILRACINATIQSQHLYLQRDEATHSCSRSNTFVSMIAQIDAMVKMLICIIFLVPSCPIFAGVCDYLRDWHADEGREQATIETWMGDGWLLIQQQRRYPFGFHHWLIQI